MTKNVAIIYDRQLDFGGVESHLLSLFRHIDHASYQYVIVAPISDRFSTNAAALNVKLMPFPTIKPLDLRAYRQLLKVFRSEQIDLVHVHSPAAAIPARLAAHRLGIPSIVTVHFPATQYYGHQRYFRASTGRFLYINLDRLLNHTWTERLIYVSRLVREECVNKNLSPGQRSIVIRNGVNLEAYKGLGDRGTLRARYNVPDNMVVITFVGRLVEDKGLDLLLDAAGQLNNRNVPAFQIWLIGSGPQEDFLRQKANLLKLEHQVIFLGFQSNVPEYLNASDIFILPSRHEAMPIAILESLAAGLPSIVTNVGENADLIDNGVNGFVVPPNSISALKDAIQQLLSDPELALRMGHQASLKSIDYSEQLMVSQVEQVYKEILG